MRSDCTRAAGVILLAASSFVGSAQQLPPTTRTDNFRESFHGQELVDPYHWLEDSTSPPTRQWIHAQNAYARALLDPLPIRTRILGRLNEMLRHDVRLRPLRSSVGDREVQAREVLDRDSRTGLGVLGVFDNTKLEALFTLFFPAFVGIVVIALKYWDVHMGLAGEKPRETRDVGVVS